MNMFITEAKNIMHHLGQRVGQIGGYTTTESFDDVPCLIIHMSGADVIVFVDEDEDDNGRSKMALSYLARHGEHTSVHLNHWRRPKQDMSIDDLVTGLWDAFWDHELENQQKGRASWMHGPILPALKKEYLVDMADVMDIFGDM